MTIGIYKIENLVNGKIYVGQSIDIERRWKQHSQELRSNRHFNYHLQNSWNKHGGDNFLFDILDECSEENLNSKESCWINKLDSLNKNKGYNMTDICGVTKQTQEVRDKISKARIGMKFSDEHRENIRQARLGTKSSEATKAKLSEIHKNQPIGEEAYASKLTGKQAKEIIDMLLNGYRDRDIADKVGVGRRNINAIRNKKSWRHLTNEMSFISFDAGGNIKNKKVS